MFFNVHEGFGVSLGWGGEGLEGAQRFLLPVPASSGTWGQTWRRWESRTKAPRWWPFSPGSALREAFAAPVPCAGPAATGAG